MIVDVVADTEELAKEAAYFAFIRLFIGPYPGRKTTAGNAAAPIMPVVIPVSEVFTLLDLPPAAAGRPGRAVPPRRASHFPGAPVGASRRPPTCACMTPPRSSAARTPDRSRSRSTCSSPTTTAIAPAALLAAAHARRRRARPTACAESTVKGVWWDDRDPRRQGLAAALVVQQPTRSAPTCSARTCTRPWPPAELV